MISCFMSSCDENITNAHGHGVLQSLAGQFPPEDRPETTLDNISIIYPEYFAPW